MIKVFLTADIAVGMAPLAVKFAYQSFKYLVLNDQFDFVINRTPYYRNWNNLLETSLTCHRKLQSL